MKRNILKIYLILSFAAIAFGLRKPQLASTFIDGYSSDLNIQPFVDVNGKLYHFGQSKVSWYKASLICRSMGGFLASFDSQEELAAVSDYLVGKYPLDRWWWLSGSDLDSEGDFFWFSSGERLTFADWSAGQPDNAGGNENCVHLWYQKPKYQMNDWICKQAAFYICEADKPKTVLLTVF